MNKLPTATMIIGTMCGTSMNSFDIVTVEFKDNVPIIHSTGVYKLPDDYKNKYLKIINVKGHSTLQELGELNTWTGIVFAEAINKFIIENNLNKKNIAAIANHGQTIWHSPNTKWPFTLQLGDSNVIAEKTGIITVGDFRNADIAAGGQGAPLAPVFHKAVFASRKEARCIVNIGGFSNISILEYNKYLGFDTGPGNCLIDQWTSEHFNKAYDESGAIAKTGKVIPELLAVLLKDPYFSQTAPKSTGREYFNSAWLQRNLDTFSTKNYRTEDVLITLVHLTAYTIANAIKTYADPSAKIYIYGGGAHNNTLLEELSILLGKEVQTTNVLGIDPDWVEPVLFAWLARQRIIEQPINLMEITGSSHPVILGALYKPN
jgi:anhydro-N-acetylmuramic acid kinase